MAKDDRISEAVKALRADGIQYVRFELPDLHGTSRSKLVPIDAVEGYARRFADAAAKPIISINSIGAGINRILGRR